MIPGFRVSKELASLSVRGLSVDLQLPIQKVSFDLRRKWDPDERHGPPVSFRVR